MSSSTRIWEGALGSVRGWFSLPRLRSRRITDEWARRQLVSRASLVRLNSPLTTERDRELILTDLLERGHTVPLHWLSRDAAKSGDRSIRSVAVARLAAGSMPDRICTHAARSSEVMR